MSEIQDFCEIPTRVFAYGRASTDTQVMSCPQQSDECESWFHNQIRTGKLHKDSQWMGFFADEATSASTPWLERPMGNYLKTHCRPGDLVVSAKYDRCIRSLHDCVFAFEFFLKADIFVKFIDAPEMDLTTANGRMFCGVMAIVKAYEREVISARSKEAHRHRIKNGLPVTRAYIGWRAVDGTGSRILIPNERERNTCLKLLKLYNEMDKKALKVADYNLEHRIACYPDGKPWGREKVRRAIIVAQQGFPKIPFYARNTKLECVAVISERQKGTLDAG